MEWPPQKKKKAEQLEKEEQDLIDKNIAARHEPVDLHSMASAVSLEEQKKNKEARIHMAALGLIPEEAIPDRDVNIDRASSPYNRYTGKENSAMQRDMNRLARQQKRVASTVAEKETKTAEPEVVPAEPVVSAAPQAEAPKRSRMEELKEKLKTLEYQAAHMFEHARKHDEIEADVLAAEKEVHELEIAKAAEMTPEKAARIKELREQLKTLEYQAGHMYEHARKHDEIEAEAVAAEDELRKLESAGKPVKKKSTESIKVAAATAKAEEKKAEGPDLGLSGEEKAGALDLDLSEPESEPAVYHNAREENAAKKKEEEDSKGDYWDENMERGEMAASASMLEALDREDWQNHFGSAPTDRTPLEWREELRKNALEIEKYEQKFGINLPGESVQTFSRRTKGEATPEKPVMGVMEYMKECMAERSEELDKKAEKMGSRVSGLVASVVGAYTKLGLKDRLPLIKKIIAGAALVTLVGVLLTGDSGKDIEAPAVRTKATSLKDGTTAKDFEALFAPTGQFTTNVDWKNIKSEVPKAERKMVEEEIRIPRVFASADGLEITAETRAYEPMIKSLWKQLQGMRLNPEYYLEGSDLRKLVEAKKETVDTVIREIAADPKHKFFYTDSAGEHIFRVDKTMHMTIGDDSQIAMIDENGKRFTEAPAEKYVIPGMHPEVAKETQTSSEAVVEAPVAEEKSVAPEHVERFQNAKGIEIDPTQAHVFEEENGVTVVYGSNFDAQYEVAQDFAMKHPNTVVQIQAENLVSYNGKKERYVFDMVFTKPFPLIPGNMQILGLTDPDAARVRTINPDAFTKQLDK